MVTEADLPVAEKATTGNSIPAPPRLSGKSEEDVLTLQAWVGDLHRTLAREANVIGTQALLIDVVNALRAALLDMGTGGGTIDPETIDDRVAALLAAGSGISLSYNDAGDQLTITNTSAGGVTDGDKGDVVVSGSGTVWTLDSAVVTAFARTLLDDADAVAMRATLGLGSAALVSTGSFAAAVHNHDGGDIVSGTVPAARLPPFSVSAAGIVPASGGGTANFLRADGTWAAPPTGGIAGTAVVTVANGSWQHEQTVAAVGVTAASKVLLSLGTMADTAENAADMLDITSMGATPGTDTLTILLSFATPTAGAIPINWSAA